MQVLGIIDVLWNGRNIPVEKGGKFRPGGIKNAAVHYGRKTGRAQDYEGFRAEVVTNLERGQRLKDLMITEEGELQVICDTGQTYVCRDAFRVDNTEATGGEGGKITLVFEGSEAEEIL